jgi:hypothetical protein
MEPEKINDEKTFFKKPYNLGLELNERGQSE